MANVRTERAGAEGNITIVTIDRPDVRNCVDGPTAEVEYRFVAAETDVVAEYDGEWIKDDGSGNDRTFPSGDGIYHYFRINE